MSQDAKKPDPRPADENATINIDPAELPGSTPKEPAAGSVDENATINIDPAELAGGKSKPSGDASGDESATINVDRVDVSVPSEAAPQPQEPNLTIKVNPDELVAHHESGNLDATMTFDPELATGQDEGPDATLALASGEAPSGGGIANPTVRIQEGSDLDELLKSGGKLPNAAELENRRLGDYKVLSKLGEGGMGYVLKAHDVNLNRFVAMKLLHPHLAQNGAFVQQFRVEAEALAKLDHPNVVNVYNLGSSGSTVYFTMQFIRGYELTDLLTDQGQLSPEKVVELMIPVAEGLAYTHSYGIQHRDLKPANIMIEEATGRPMVTDFGLAKIDLDMVQRRIDPDGKMHIDLGEKNEGALMGTPAYMAPELFAPDIYTGNEAQPDIYALGVLMYQLLTGTLPFSGDDIGTIFSNALTADVAPISEFVTRAPPPALHRCIKKAMARDPKDRYASMERLLEDLRGVARLWEKAEETEERAQMSREMARAMQTATSSRAPTGSRVKRLLLVSVLGIVGVGLALWLISSLDGDGGPGNGGDPDSISGLPLGSRETDLSWELGATVRVFGSASALSRGEEYVEFDVYDLVSEVERFAHFRVPTGSWEGRIESTINAERDVLVRGKVISEPSADGTVQFDASSFKRWLVGLREPLYKLVGSNGVSSSVTGISGDDHDAVMMVIGTIIRVDADVDAAGAPVLHVEIYDENMPDDADAIGMTFVGEIPKTDGVLPVRIGDVVTATGYVDSANWLVISDPKHHKITRITGFDR